MRLAFALMLVCSFCVSMLTTRTSAQATTQTQDIAPPRYQELVDHGLAESAAGRFAEARADFRQAHALYPNARTLRVIGMVAYELRDYVDAVRHLELALVEPRRELDAEQRFQVTALLEQARNLVARYTTSELPQGAEVIVDGRPATLEAGGVLLLAVGEHSVRVRSNGRISESALTVRGGEQAPLPVMLEATPIAAPAPAPTTAPTVIRGDVLDPFAEPEPSEEDARTQPFPVGPVLTITVGVAMAAAGVVMLVMGMNDISSIEDAPLGTEWSSVKAANDRAPIFTGLGAGLLALGGATGVLGCVWLASDSSDERAPEPELALRVGARGTW